MGSQMSLGRTVVDDNNMTDIPPKAMKLLGLRPGSIVEFEIVGDHIVVRRAAEKPRRKPRKRKGKKSRAI
jgi:bifunctional DNA-binding transcriptional regulator/antitoxin component of YhaV-PrlF toxin-antitoxin module